MKIYNLLYSDPSDLIPVKEKVLKLPPENVLIQVFMGTPESSIAEKVLEELKSAFPGYPVIGTSTSGEILNGTVLNHTTVISFSLFDSTIVRSVLIGQNDDIASAGGEIAGVLRNSELKSVIVFACGMKDNVYVDQSSILTSLESELGSVPVSGGLSGGIFKKQESFFVFTEKGFSFGGFAAAGLSGKELRVLCDYNVSWIPIGKQMMITKSENKRVFSIDDKNVKDLYQHYLGIDLSGASSTFMDNFPLMIRRHSRYIPNPVSRVLDDGSVEFIHQMHPGEAVQFSICDVHLLEYGAVSLKNTLKEFKSEAVFVFSCESRKSILGDDIYIDMKTLNGSPASIGFFTYGEFLKPPGEPPQFFQQTMTVLALSEKSKDAPSEYSDLYDLIEPEVQESDRFKLQKVLIRLVKCITGELEERNQQLDKMANSDTLTGLGNRRNFDMILNHVIKTYSRSNDCFSLIIFDVDYFKLFNDHYGHVEGDDALRGIGAVMKNMLKRSGDKAFRYGGEEFACILVSTDSEGAALMAEKIRKSITGLGIPHQRSDVSDFLSVSLGVLTVHPDKNTEEDSIIKQCDQLLYKAKEQGRNRFVSGCAE